MKFCANIVIFLICYSYADWEKTNSPSEINVNAFAVSGKKLYAGTDNGLYCSSDSGISWTTIKNVKGHVNCLYAGQNKIYAASEDGIFFLDDNNSTWKNATLNDPEKKFSDCNALVIKDTELYSATNIGIFRYNGKNWIFIDSIPADYSFTALAGDSEVLFVGTDGGGLYGSLNKGLSWSRLKFPSSYINSILIDNKKLIVSTIEGLVIADYDGLNINNAASAMVDQNVKYVQVLKNNVLIGITEKGVFFSYDNGKKVLFENSGLEATKINCIVEMGNRIFAGTEGQGIFYRDFKRQEWKKSNSGICALSRAINAMVAKGESLLAAVSESENGSDGCMYITTDNGESWITPQNEISGKNIRSMASDGKNIFAGNAHTGEIFISSDNGFSWESLVSESFEGICGISALAVKGTDIFACTHGCDLGYGGVYYSNNSGKDWEIITEPTDYCAVTIKGVDAIAVRCFICEGDECAGSRIFQLKNDGTIIDSLDSGLPDSIALNSIVLNGKKIIAGWIGKGRQQKDRIYSGILISEDFGRKWKDFNSGLPSDVMINSLYTYKEIIIVATSKGLFYSNCDLLSWHSISKSPIAFDVFSIAIGEKYLFAGTSNQGIWRLLISEIKK